MAGIIDTNIVTQIAFVVKDMETTKQKLADFLGVEPPDHFATQKSPNNMVKGESAPDISALLCFFQVGPNLTIELIEPNGISSVWQDVLDEQGEGFHHIAFGIKGMDEKVKACEDAGMKCLQRGKGYTYLDGRDDLKFIVELLGE
ncbi:MAG: VOC family protein [Oscillospiraceae bacterium]|jgi:catechol 2,3-dioxygenase-like lactoylglutathione lyase family enzyme|nr:VOC family protein [Oscillospiraceae bacterium]